MSNQDWTPERVEKLGRWMSRLFDSDVKLTTLKPGETWPEFYNRLVMGEPRNPWRQKSTGWRRIS